jgi:molecular chaperone HscB
VLERKFQALQRQVHPDMFVTKTPEEQGIATARSAGASEAYQTLKDPLSRARYVLGMRGVDLEVQKVQDSELLMEVMEVQEKLDDISDKEELQRMVDELSAKVDRCLKEAQELLEYQGDIALVPATQLVIRAQYFYKLKQDGEKLIPP